MTFKSLVMSLGCLCLLSSSLLSQLSLLREEIELNARKAISRNPTYCFDSKPVDSSTSLNDRINDRWASQVYGKSDAREIPMNERLASAVTEIRSQVPMIPGWWLRLVRRGKETVDGRLEFDLKEVPTRDIGWGAYSISTSTNEIEGSSLRIRDGDEVVGVEVRHFSGGRPVDGLATKIFYQYGKQHLAICRCDNTAFELWHFCEKSGARLNWAQSIELRSASSNFEMSHEEVKCVASLEYLQNPSRIWLFGATKTSVLLAEFDVAKGTTQSLFVSDSFPELKK